MKIPRLGILLILLITIQSNFLNAQDGDPYFKEKDFVLNGNAFTNNRLYINNINDAFFLANERWTVTGATSPASMFDGNYDTREAIAAGTSKTFTIDFGGNYSGYPYGYLLISFYSTYYPESVTGRVYCNYEPHGIGWHDLSFSEIDGDGSIYKAYQSKYLIQQIEITVTAPADKDAWVGRIEMALDRPTTNEMPYVDKFRANTIYKEMYFLDNLGIGTTSPGYKLDVVGTIRAQEVKVDMDGADFVFEDDYNLQSLSEIETFIMENKHLPDIAPAEEMQENGVSVGEMNAKLLQKIEELMLHTINQQKEINELKHQLNQITLEK